MRIPSEMAWRVPADWRPSAPQSRKVDDQLDSHHDVGVPVGGIGTGTISRAPSGGFTRWTLRTGAVDYFDHGANGFALWQDSAAGQPPVCKALRAAPSGDAPPGWHFDAAGVYAALFPKAWHEYPATPENPVAVTIEQMSPVAPALQDDCDLPVGLFRVHLANRGNRDAAASVMFSFANLVGTFGHAGGPRAKAAGQTNREVRSDFLHGIVFARDFVGEIDAGEGQFLIGVRRNGETEITICPAFDPARDGQSLWTCFSNDGRLSPLGETWVGGGGFSEFQAPELCGAIAARRELKPGEETTVDFCLVFDMPVIRFGQGRRWRRHYTGNWGGQGTSAEQIAEHALKSADKWSKAIDLFHRDCADRIKLPNEATALAINELYFISDGMTVWTAPENDAPARFGVIECPDYPLYNTLDLWVYGSHAIAAHFPQIARSVSLDYARQVSVEDAQVRHHLRSSNRFARQRRGMLPHDLGAPDGDPFVRANDYAYQDSGIWKDLNTQFVLTAWRDSRLAPDEFVAEIYPSIVEAMNALSRFDRDGDGLIENDGIPDQTFDNVPMTGASAYCGGLWLAALRAAAALGERAGDRKKAGKWRDISDRAEKAFDRKLWNGRYYKVDTDGKFSDSIFSEQLFGPALARMHGLGDVVPAEKARSALAIIFERNFVKAGKGTGVVAITSDRHDSSLYAPAGEAGLQWDEVLIGFNYSLAAQLRIYGMEDECRELMGALARELGPRRGLHFRTPAAIEVDRPLMRAQMNMRPLGVWMLAWGQDYRNG